MILCEDGLQVRIKRETVEGITNLGVPTRLTIGFVQDSINLPWS
jgi:hypothetical protein